MRLEAKCFSVACGSGVWSWDPRRKKMPRAELVMRGKQLERPVAVERLLRDRGWTRRSRSSSCQESGCARCGERASASSASTAPPAISSFRLLANGLEGK